MTLEQFNPYIKQAKNNIEKKLGYDNGQDAFQEVLIYLWNKPQIIINYPKTYLNNICNWYILKNYKNNVDNIDLNKTHYVNFIIMIIPVNVIFF